MRWKTAFIISNAKEQELALLALILDHLLFFYMTKPMEIACKRCIAFHFLTTTTANFSLSRRHFRLNRACSISVSVVELLFVPLRQWTLSSARGQKFTYSCPACYRTVCSLNDFRDNLRGCISQLTLHFNYTTPTSQRTEVNLLPVGKTTYRGVQL